MSWSGSRILAIFQTWKKWRKHYVHKENPKLQRAIIKQWRMLFEMSRASLIEGCWGLLCYQNIFVVTVFPCFLSTSNYGLQNNLWLFLECLMYSSHLRHMFDLLDCQDWNLTSWLGMWSVAHSGSMRRWGDFEWEAKISRKRTGCRLFPFGVTPSCSSMLYIHDTFTSSLLTQYNRQRQLETAAFSS